MPNTHTNLFSHFINPNLEPMEAFYVLVARKTKLIKEKCVKIVSKNSIAL